jgi:hypothetical protein
VRGYVHPSRASKLRDSKQIVLVRLNEPNLPNRALGLSCSGVWSEPNRAGSKSKTHSVPTHVGVRITLSPLDCRGTNLNLNLGVNQPLQPEVTWACVRGCNNICTMQKMASLAKPSPTLGMRQLFKEIVTQETRVGG